MYQEKVLCSEMVAMKYLQDIIVYRSIYILSTLIIINLRKMFLLFFKNKNFKRLCIDETQSLYLSFSEQNIFNYAKLAYREL